MVKKKRQSDAHNEPTDSSDENAQCPLAVSGSCQHAKKSVDTTKLRKLLKKTGLLLECEQCAKSTTKDTKDHNTCDDSNFEYDKTLWLCLQCGTQLCGRSKNQHALQHFKISHSDSHALTMNTRTFDIWCYQCDGEVRANSRKNLLECVEIVKKAQKPALVQMTQMKMPQTSLSEAQEAVITPANEFGGDSNNSNCALNSKTVGTNENACNWNIRNNSTIPLPPPLPSIASSVLKRTNGIPFTTPPPNSFATYPYNLNVNLSAITTDFLGNLTPNKISASNKNELSALPRVRGLTNLGNTCFFNAVMQCLAQTPYLLDVLKESEEPGEEFVLPGGVFKFKNDENVELPIIRGTLSSWGSLTSALAYALNELQSGGGVFTPSRLFEKLCNKCPQFRGGDQHDSHELLRHLLESVRSEDLKRYQRVILHNLGYKDQDISTVSEEMRQKCKIYGNQAADRILRPEQVFRGFLVSTLTCQVCLNVSSRHEYFLDMSLPVSVEKPQPPQRRKSSPENEDPTTSCQSNISSTSLAGPSKPQVKREKDRDRKDKRSHKIRYTRTNQKLPLCEIYGSGDSRDDPPTIIGCALRDGKHVLSSTSSEGEQSDADVEDNLVDDNVSAASKELPKQAANNKIATKPTSTTYDANGNNELLSPGKSEKRGDSPENMNKDSLEDDENDSGIATSPSHVPINCIPNSETITTADATNKFCTAMKNLISVGGNKDDGSKCACENQIATKTITTATPTVTTTTTVKDNLYNEIENNRESLSLKINNKNQTQNATVLTTQMNELKLSHDNEPSLQPRRKRTQSYSDWSTTIAPRYQCEDGECSVQSCLNNFTAVELMTGNNKVGCDNCTKTMYNNDSKAKTVNTNATKQFLISSPPAVLILHLKRFQLGPRCIFRKLTRAVTFPMILDLAPFCGSKVKNLPNIDRKQKKLLYALYGIVEHSGGMYGGHYTAYVKVRAQLSKNDKRWSFLPKGSKAELDQDDEQRKKLEELLAKEKARELRLKASEDSDDFSNSCHSTSVSTPTSNSSSDKEEVNNTLEGAVGGIDEAKNVDVPLGKWYYVSDSRVKEVYEEDVLKAQAYLLFYERIY